MYGVKRPLARSLFHERARKRTSDGKIRKMFRQIAKSNQKKINEITLVLLPVEEAEQFAIHCSVPTYCVYCLVCGSIGVILSKVVSLPPLSGRPPDSRKQ